MKDCLFNFRSVIFLCFCICAQLMSAQKQVSGVVFDDQGEKLIGVTVQLKSSQQGGTITDMDGNFKIQSNSQKDILIFTYVGYKTLERQVSWNTPMKIKLESDNVFLDEIVVVGYQDMKRRDLTGSVGKVAIEDLQKVSVPNFDQALAGRVAGVQVSSSEGMPGASMNIVIRGNNSLTQENSPLYVIDGFPVEDPEIASTLSPNDIQSLDILKDASATAIYGARGANGVIMITTKKGVAGKMKINYNMSAGVQNLSNKLEMMNAYDFVKLQSEIYMASEMESSNGGYFQTYNGKKYTLEDYRNIAQYDWQDFIFRSAWQQSHNVSLSGGTESVRYNGSFSYYDQDGVVINSNYKKLNGRMNLLIKRNKLTANITGNYSHTVSSGASPSQNNYTGMNNLFYSVWGYRPVTAPNESLESLKNNIMDSGVDQLVDYRFNPILSLENEYNKRFYSGFNVNAYVEYEFIKGLKVKVSGIYSADDRRNESFNNSKTKNGYPGSTSGVNAYLGVTKKDTWLNENTIAYNTTFNKKHHLSTLAGITLQSSQYKSNTTNMKKIPFESLGMAGMSLGEPSTTSSSILESSLLSYLARANYNYASKYYLTVSFRADGSSKFDKDNRWGYFPSLSTAWNISNEKFFKPIKRVVNSLKIRAGWGQTGNNRIGEYDRFALLDMLKGNSGTYTTSGALIHSVYPENNTPTNVGVSPIRLANKSLKWETTSQTNVGLDVSLFNSRINLTIDWYKKITSDLLYYTEVPLTSGYGGATKNIGKVDNTGLELTLNTVNIKTKDFQWTSNFNIAFNRNKVKALAEGVNAKTSMAYFDSNFNSIPSYIAKVGYPIGMMYGYLYEGTYKLDEFDKVGNSYVLKSGIPYFSADGKNKIQPGYPKYSDINGDGVINDDDRTMIGRGEALHTGGFTNNFSYKGFDLSVFLQWSYGNDILNANRLIFESTFNKRKNLNQFASYADRWSMDNQESNIPCVNSSAGNNVFSSRVIEDGSYLRIKDVVLGYSFPKHWLKKISIDKLRVYVSAQNLMTFTSYSGYDPEVSIRNSALTPGLDYSAYPRTVNFNFGINVGF